MIERKEIFTYVKEKFDTQPDYPWFKYPDYAVLRHEGEGKWYGIIMSVPRIKLGLTQKQLAEMLGVERTTVSKWETGKSIPRKEKLLALKKILKCSIEDIYH